MTTLHPDGLAAAKACAIPGRCIFCEEPLPPQARGRKAVICRERDCASAYNNAWRRDHADRRKPQPSKGETTWHCGCGITTRRSGWGSHKKNCMYAAIAFPVVVVPPARLAARREVAR